MTNTLTRLLLTAALCGLFLLSEAQERNAVSAPDPAAPRMPADSISRDYRLDGVVIGTQRPPSPLGSIAEGRFRLLMRNSSALPRFAGSIDPMRILQLMPGVQTAAEGNSGLYVRGNDAGQNLILLNQAPLYAHAHLLGFFSVFNPGQVASFELSKTGGGRIETAMQPATVVVQSREETGVRWASKATWESSPRRRPSRLRSQTARRCFSRDAALTRDGSSAPFRRKAKTT